MRQISLFDEPSVEDLLIDAIGEPIEKFFVQNKVDHLDLYYCKVLTKNNVYDISVFKGFQYDPVINHQAPRKKFHHLFLKKYFNLL